MTHGVQATTAQDEAGSPAIDLAHLGRQTLDDPAIQREVLGMFALQLEAAREGMALVGGADRRDLAHRLKGTALGVGAFRLAGAAARIERDPADDALLAEWRVLADETCAFIAAIGR